MRDWDCLNLGGKWYTLKWHIRRFFNRLITHKCEAKDCERRLKGKYRWCGLECYMYCGGELSHNKKDNS